MMVFGKAFGAGIIDDGTDSFTLYFLFFAAALLCASEKRSSHPARERDALAFGTTSLACAGRSRQRKRLDSTTFHN